MTDADYKKGIKILEAAFLRSYKNETVLVLWDFTKDYEAGRFIAGCRMAAENEEHLPSLNRLLSYMPKKLEVKKESLSQEAWQDKVRRLYSECTSFPTQQEREDWASKLAQEDLQYLFHGKLLYEVLYPKVKAQMPRASMDMIAAACYAQLDQEMSDYFYKKNPTAKDLASF